MSTSLDPKINIQECWKNFALKMIPANNAFNKQVHLSSYLPWELRKELFDTIWFAVNKGSSPISEDIDKNWKSFWEHLKIVKEKLDKIVSG